jgi:hypothetical protein
MSGTTIRRDASPNGFRLVPGSGVRLGQFIAPNGRSRESGNPGQPARSAALDPRFPGGDDKDRRHIEPGCQVERAVAARSRQPTGFPVALIAALVLGEKFSTARKLGRSLIWAGALIIVGRHAAACSPSPTFGDGLFLFAAFASPGYRSPTFR